MGRLYRWFYIPSIRIMTNTQLSTLVYAIAFGDGMPDQLCKLIVAQAKHETDDFSSHAFEYNNNCFGYKYVKGAKWQMGPGITSTEHDPYAHYEDVAHSVHEICDWIKRRQHEGKFPADLRTITSPAQYAQLLKACGYYGDTLSDYTTGLNHFLNSLS